MPDTLHLLLVEDDGDHAELFARFARASALGEVSIARATSLTEATDQVSDPKWHAVVLDLGLPETTGIETLTAVMQLRPPAPVVVLTAEDDLNLAMQAVRAGAQDYLCKQELQPSTIARSVRYAIERAGLAAQLTALNAAHTAFASAFASAAAHELKTPLRRIAAHTELIGEALGSNLPRDVRDSLVEVDAASRQMWEMMDALVKFSDAGTLKREPAPESPRQLVTEALSRSQPALDLASAQVQCELDPDVPYVNVERTSMIEVLCELFTNAATYRIAPGPSIRVESEASGESVCLSVVSDGMDVDPRHLEKIFEPMRRLHADERFGGLGMGLATCRRVLRAHGGEIWAERPATGGLRVRMTLPKAEFEGASWRAPAFALGPPRDN